MPLVETKLAKNLEGLFTSMKDNPMSESEYAGELAKIINSHILTATVTVNAGIAVGTPAGPGSTSAPGTGSLS